MKKWVSKEDVQKGLVDVTKPLNEQKEYLDKVQKDQRDRNPNKGRTEYTKKRERENKPKYNWNRRDVTQETPIPQAPKKQVAKPDKQKFYQQLNDFKKNIQELNKKKSDLIQELKITMRNTSDNKKNSRTVKTKYSGLLNQKHNSKKILHQEIKLLEQKRDEIDRQLTVIRQKIKAFERPDTFEDCSTQQLQRRLEKTQQKLTTASLSKRQQNQTNMRILQIKRAMAKSRSEADVIAEVSKFKDQNQILYKQLKQVKSAINDKYTQLKQVKSEIGQINQDLGKQKTQPEDNRTPDQIKTDFDKRIQALNQQKIKIKGKIDKLREAHEKHEDQYEDYKDLMSYINMIKQQKQSIKKWKEEQQKRKKQRQQQQKRRQKQYEQRQKRRQQKQKRDEERKKQIQQKKQKLQKQRQDYINRNPHHQKIQVCRNLIDYCESLKPENAIKKFEKREQRVAQPILELNPKDSKDWQKQLKKGAQVIVSKKLRDEQQPNKKVVKQKKKKQKQVTQTVSAFTHHIDTAKMFEKINILAPLTAAQIDETIKQLNQRIELFGKPSEQQINAYKQRAGKQFDSLHGFHDEQRKKGHGHYKQKDQHNHEEHKVIEHEHKEHKQKPKYKKPEKTEAVITEKEFPGLQ